MPFQRKNVVISQPQPGPQKTPQVSSQAPRKERPNLQQGVRPSALDGRLTISTGTASLDQLLAGHSGLPLGTCLLIEESGTTDFGGVALRYYAAEGLVQGHHVHVLGYGQGWRNELPGLRKQGRQPKVDDEDGKDKGKMKIAWRYEALESRGLGRSDDSGSFCHAFDLSKRLDTEVIRGSLVTHPLLHAGAPSHPLVNLVHGLEAKLKSSSPDTIHRIVVPGFLTPGLYSPLCCHPREALQFLHGLRALLRRYSARLSAAITLPVSLHRRTSGLTRWLEHLCDAVVEFSALFDLDNQDSAQGQLRIHTLPVHHERGGGSEVGEWRENLSFRLSGTDGLVIRPFSLPPVGDGVERDNDQLIKEKKKKEGLEF